MSTPTVLHKGARTSGVPVGYHETNVFGRDADHEGALPPSQRNCK